MASNRVDSDNESGTSGSPLPDLEFNALMMVRASVGVIRPSPLINIVSAGKRTYDSRLRWVIQEIDDA